MKRYYRGIAHNKVTMKSWYTRPYECYHRAYNAAKNLAKKKIPAENAFIVVVDENGERVV